MKTFAGLVSEAPESCERTGTAENHQVGTRTPTPTLTQASPEEDAGAAECAAADSAPPDEAPVATELSCDRAESESEALAARPARRRHKRRRAQEPSAADL